MTTKQPSSLQPVLYLDAPETVLEGNQAVDAQENYVKWRVDAGLPPHISPGSVLVAAMGAHWYPGCLEAMKAMAKHTLMAGRFVRFYAEQDRCYEPYDGLGTMRNLAYMRAIQEGFEYILYVDNDVLPEKDALVRLQDRCLPIMSPRIAFPDGLDYNMPQATIPENSGLVMGTSVLLSFLLFKTEVFLPFALSSFWDNARGADEEFHFRKLAMLGHHPMVDTSTLVKVQNAPHFPFDHIDRSWLGLREKDAIEREREMRLMQLELRIRELEGRLHAVGN